MFGTYRSCCVQNALAWLYSTYLLFSGVVNYFLSSKYCIHLVFNFVSLFVIYNNLFYVRSPDILLDFVTIAVVHFYTDVTSWHCFWSKYLCYFDVFFLLFPYLYGFCSPVRIHRMSINDMIWYMVWYIEYDMIYDMIYDIWYMIHDMIWYDMIWYDMIWYDMIWYDMIWYDMTGRNETRNSHESKAVNSYFRQFLTYI